MRNPSGAIANDFRAGAHNRKNRRKSDSSGPPNLSKRLSAFFCGMRNLSATGYLSWIYESIDSFKAGISLTSQETFPIPSTSGERTNSEGRIPTFFTTRNLNLFYYFFAMENPKPTGTKQIDIASLPIVGTDAVPSVYCNNAEINFAPWDVRLIFTEVVSLGATPEKVLRADVVMSPPHAKALAAALTVTLQEYEKIYGEIKIPEAKIPAQVH
jgi:hypothetical protein